MFLDVLCRRNPALIKVTIALHQQGRIPANCYVIDLDAVTTNAQCMRQESDRLGLRLFAMTKQMGRNPDFCSAVRSGGIDAAVAVDMDCARLTHRAGLKLGHIGHLVQVARAEVDAAAQMRPDFWTVFNTEKAEEAAAAAGRAGYIQSLLARVQAPGDTFYNGHEGGFDAAEALSVAERIDRLANVRFAGITTFPALLFDQKTRGVVLTHNLRTLEETAKRLRLIGRNDLQVNAPGTTSTATLAALAGAGATQAEPGHGLTGTTPLHAYEDLPEVPSVVYLSEISHFAGGRAYCFGGGLYVDPVFAPYRLEAIVTSEPTESDWAKVPVAIPPREGIDYYGLIDLPASRTIRVGDSVVFGFRIQAFVTRAKVVGVSGITVARPEPQGIYTALGDPTSWPN
jgi:predicted amino acid racemase